MKQPEAIKKTEQKPLEQPSAAWLLMDAVVFSLALYKTIEFALLRADGVIDNITCFLVIGPMAICVGMLRRAFINWHGGKLIPGLIAEYIVAGGLTALMARLSFVQRKTQSFSWLPLEWHKLLSNHSLLVKVSPGFAAAIAVAVIFVVWLFSKQKRAALIAVVVPVIALTFLQCSVVTKEQSYAVYIITYVGPLLVVAAAALAKAPRLGARATVIAAAALILLWHYIGWVPLILNKSFTRMPGVEKLYPAPGHKPDFPLAFFRDFQVEPSGRRLFTAYGPTSGVIRFDLGAKKLDLLDTPGALVRYVYLDPPRNEFYALDWVSSDMLTLSMDTMKVLRRENMYFKDGLFVPVHFMLRKDKIYATYSERPGLAEFSIKPLKLRRKLMFRDLKLTKFRSGVWKEAIDEQTGKLFVEIGMTDAIDKFLLARVDTAAFKVDATAVLPEGGLELLPIPSRRTIIATSFFNNNMYEFGMDSMRLIRKLEGPRSCRNLVYDGKRNLLIGTGFLDGELRVMDYNTGKTLLTASVGNKAASLFLTPDNETLYLGGAWGIFRVRLEKFLANTLKGR